MAANNKVKERSKNLNIVFILDITGSMGNQIDGVKKMVSNFCKIDRQGCDVHVWTFTENAKNCFVTHSPNGLKSNDLVQYVNNIKLGCPPGMENVSYLGGDSPENVLSAVYSLSKQFTQKDNVLSFVITDDMPHHKAFGSSNESLNEKKYLNDNDCKIDDVFLILNDVIDRLNITLVPVLFGTIKLLF